MAAAVVVVVVAAAAVLFVLVIISFVCCLCSCFDTCSIEITLHPGAEVVHRMFVSFCFFDLFPR